MIHLGFYDYSEIAFGLLSWWIGVYLFSKNPTAILSWLVFALLGGFGIVVGADPIYANAPNLLEYAKWQKVLDFPLYFGPIICYHASLLTEQRIARRTKYLLAIAYLIAVIFIYFDLSGSLIVNTTILRPELKFSDFRYGFIFSPGPLLLPLIVFECYLLMMAAINFLHKINEEFWRFFLPAFGCLLFIICAASIGLGYYTNISYTAIFLNGLMAIATLLIIYSIIRYQLFAPSERIIFGRDFLYKTLGMTVILALYIGVFRFSSLQISFSVLILLITSLILILSTHSFYEWLITFINDIFNNISSGLSVVSDSEIHQVIKNFNKPESLENSTLLRLNLVNNKLRKVDNKTPVDILKETIKETIDYFRPDESPHKRNKKNLKYELLRMLTFNEAEEGQILWELGFEEYPVRIMSKERQLRPPMFKIESPSDYSYTSRNAYLALKKEAIHDVTWRISYLEKLSKKRLAYK